MSDLKFKQHRKNQAKEMTKKKICILKKFWWKNISVIIFQTIYVLNEMNEVLEKEVPLCFCLADRQTAAPECETMSLPSPLKWLDTRL